MSLNMFARSPFPFPGVHGVGGPSTDNIFGTVISDITQVGGILDQGLTGQNPDVTATLEKAGGAALGDIFTGIGAPNTPATTQIPPPAAQVLNTPSSGLGSAGILVALGAAALLLLGKKR